MYGTTRDQAASQTTRSTSSRRHAKVIERCILMATDPGDLVLDPTCGSGTTAYVAEQWGRRWITIDTSRVALALARTRLMAARYPWYLLADSPRGPAQGGRADRQAAARQRRPTTIIRQGFVYERVPHITLKSIANNSRDRRHLGEMAGGARTAARRAQRRARQAPGRNGKSRASADAELARAAPPSRTPHGGRRASPARRRSTPRSPQAADVEYALRPPYADNAPRPRRRPVHGREPVAAPRRCRRRGRN